MPSQTPRLEEVIEAAINQKLESFWTAIPAFITRYDSLNQRADIRIMISNAHENSDGIKYWANPDIYDVPVIFPGGHARSTDKPYRITFPIGGIDTGLFIVSTLPITEWYYTSGYSIVNLKEARGSRNNMCHGFLLPGLWTNGAYKTEAPEDAMVLWGDKVKIGGADGTQPVIKGNDYLTAEDSFLSDLSDMVSELKSYATVAGANTLAAKCDTLKTRIKTFREGDYKSDVVEVK